MTTFRFSFMAIALAGAASAQDFPVPSGLKVSLFDVIVEADPAIARFRFLAPDLTSNDYEKVVDDFQFLCDEVASPALAQNNWGQGDVIISYSAAELPFGETAPEITQFFQPFSLNDNACQWEDY